MSSIEGAQTIKDLSVDEDTALLFINLMMLRMICTEKCKCRLFGDISPKVFSLIVGIQYMYTALVGDDYQHSEYIKSAEMARRGLVQVQIRNMKRETTIPNQKINTAYKLNQADLYSVFLLNYAKISSQTIVW